MDTNGFYFEEGFPFHGRKLEAIKNFLAENDLTYDEQIQYTVALKTPEQKLAGCGSRHENILKCIAVNPEFQGEGCLQLLMTQLVKNAFEHHITHLFLFTKPMYLQMFSDMGFYKLMQTEDILLMENRQNGIQEYLKKEASAFPPVSGQTIGAIVMNANPFTRGHQYLVEQACAACDFLHVFVLSEDASEFPAALRLELVKKGCEQFPNVAVHGSSDYLISHATFPDYFLKDKAGASDKAAVLDLMIFGTYFKEAFGITRRFVGEEPFSRVTRAYNEQMKNLLPRLGIQVTEIPRRTLGSTVISATLVREKFLKGDLEAVKDLVPPSTYAFLASPQGEALRNHLLDTGALL